MIESQPLPIGIHCEDPEQLAKRVMVSGLQHLEMDGAEERGYTYNPWGVIVPRKPRRATPREVEQIIATEHTEHVVQMVRFPAELGELALSQCQPRQYLESLPSPNIRQPLADGIEGVLLELRHNKAGSLTTSVNTSQLWRNTEKFPSVGMHIDSWATTDINYLISVTQGGAGPGAYEAAAWRHHLFSPFITRDAVDNDEPRTLLRDTTHHIVNEVLNGRRGGYTDDPLLYWLRLDGPQGTGSGRTTEGIIGAKTAEFLHDGSLLGARLGSTAIMASTASIPVGKFPSLV